MNEELFWRQIYNNLENNISTVLCVIIDQTGSAPNSPGAKLYVTPNNIVGTVGGGVSEHQLVEKAKSLIKEEKISVEKIYMEHTGNATKHSSGMICSGTQTFALVYLGQKDIPVIERIVESWVKAKLGILSITEEGITFEFNRTIKATNLYIEKEESWKYQEQLGRMNKLYIIGGGHVSLALSKIMKTLGFHITVFDDRENLPTMVTNTYANEKEVIDYEDITKFIPEGDNIYITIMTFGHISDEKVLEQLIKKKYKYVGMMASKHKKREVCEHLKQKGVSKTLLESVYSPIGLNINSITPEEIAISIAAEIILVKNSEDIDSRIRGWAE